MIPLEYVLATVLLASPVEANEPDDLAPALDSLRPTMQALAVQWEILDPREVRYILSRPEDFNTDQRLLRRRYQELCDAPPLHDAMIFPDRALVKEMLNFNRAYKQHLTQQQSLDTVHWWDLHETLQEVDRLHGIWDLVSDARCDFYYVTVRRQALKKLKETVGDQAFYSGCLPPHVPLWRFSRID